MIYITPDRRDKGSVTKCKVPEWMTLCPEKLAAARKAEIVLRDEMLAFQKEAGKNGDRAGAKFFKDEASEYMKRYRAACLLVPHYVAGDYPGDCKYVDAYNWPPDLFGALNAVIRECEA
jgi:hypothetical protein